MDRNAFIDFPFFTAYQICIKNVKEHSDLEILEWLGIHDCVKLTIDAPLTEFEWMANQLVIMENNDWTIICDNDYYDLWHYHYKNDDWKKKVGERFDLFVYMFGDSRNTFELTFYEKRKLRRKYVLEFIKWDEYEEEENYGEPLIGENLTVNSKSHYKTIAAIESQLGMSEKIDPWSMRLYGKPDNN
ncbi:MAG: hypothetical protein ACRBFS_03785 [Aureispira sp.]